MADLWTDRYKPKSPTEIIGQGKAISEALAFVESFKPGKAMMLSGPSGSGKSSIPEAIAQARSMNVIRLNASDKRTRDEVDGFAQAVRTRDLFGRGKIVLIDELEGLSGGDRGAVPGIVELVKKSMFPVFLITSDPYMPKLAPLRLVSKIVKLTKVPAPSMEKRMKEICDLEGIKHEEGVIKALARFSQGDMRSAINDLQMTSRGKASLAMSDLESVGYRDRTESIQETLPKVFRSGSVSAASKAISESDKPPEELFLWIENNLASEYSGKSLADATETVAKADVFFSAVWNQRDYRYLRYGMDMLAGLAAVPNTSGRFVLYSPPDKIIMMGRSRAKRAVRQSLCKKLGAVTHSSSSRVSREYLPYLKQALGKTRTIEGADLTPEEMDLLRS